MNIMALSNANILIRTYEPYCRMEDTTGAEPEASFTAALAVKWTELAGYGSCM